MIDINLLPTQNVVSLKESELQNRFFLALWVCTLIVAVDLVLFFLISQVYKARVSQLVAQRSQLAAQTEQLSPVALALRTVEEKTQGDTVVVGLRQDMVAVVDEVRGLAGSDIEVDDLKIGNSTVSFSGRAGSADGLNNFVNRVTQNPASSHLTNLVMRDLRIGAGGGFEFQVSAGYKALEIQGQQAL